MMYFLKRHGAYFRPGAHGYTTEILAAGLFEHNKAHSYDYATDPPVIVIPANDMLSEIKDMLQRASSLAERIEASS
jgi:hypothetical protein